MYRDFKELLSAFNAEQVRYLIVGGYAVSFHAQPRATKDLDILIGADAENGKAVYTALAKFGAPIEGLSANDFSEPDDFFRMGTPPVMVDIMPKISGVEFDAAWQRRVDVQIDDGLTAPFISREDLLAAKVSAGRAQNLVDVDALRDSVNDRQVEHAPQSFHPVTSAREELHQARQRGLEDWLKLRAQRGHSPTLEEMRAKGLEDWLKLRNQRTAEKSVDSSDQATDRAHTEKNDLSKKHDRGIDDDLKS
jgi:hypothetical protein